MHLKHNIIWRRTGVGNQENKGGKQEETERNAGVMKRRETGEE